MALYGRRHSETANGRTRCSPAARFTSPLALSGFTRTRDVCYANVDAVEFESDVAAGVQSGGAHETPHNV